MIFAYLDEFGHNGPFFGVDDPKHNTSPVFGLAGILLPEQAVRPFASYFLRQKTLLLGNEIASSAKQAYAWEKKGTNLFTARSITRYPEIRRTAFRLINQIGFNHGKIFYYGREKIRGRADLNANGLYKTVLAKALRQINSYCGSVGSNFVVVVDEHSARRELLETAAKTMYGADPVRWLSSPPFEVESDLNQNIQAADWIASIIGRLWNYQLEPQEFAKYQPYLEYFWDRIHQVATHSTVMRRPAVITDRHRARRSNVIATAVATETITIEIQQVPSAPQPRPLSENPDETPAR